MNRLNGKVTWSNGGEYRDVEEPPFICLLCTTVLHRAVERIKALQRMDMLALSLRVQGD
jgi:hypothetical protein